MLDRLIHISLRNKGFVVLFFSVIMALGTLVASRMDVDVLPDLTAPTVTVLTESHGYSAEEVEQLITFPVEMTLNGASHVRRIRSSSMMGISVVWVEFDWDTDIYKARQIVTEKLSTIQTQLPQGIPVPVLAPNASVMGEIMLIGLSSDAVNKMELREIADWQIRPRLLSLGGLANVSVIGGELKQYQIMVHPEKLGYYNVALQDVLEAISPMNKNVSGGFFNDFGQEYIIRGLGQTSSVSELPNILVKSNGDMPVKLSDIADVKVGGSPKIGAASINGKDGVIIVVQKQPDANTLKLSQRIDALLASMHTTLPPNITIHTDIFRQADFINVALQNVLRALIEGGLFVIVILFLFLMNWRVTVISIITIPISLLAAVLSLKFLGLTINTMSLGGMAIAIGSLVDDAIIDVENVFKRVRQNALLPASEKQPLFDVVFDASSEIRQSIWYSTLIIITAFIPLFFLSGMEGRLLRPLGIAFVASLIASTIVALTLTPVLCHIFLGKHQPKTELDPAMIRWLKSVYKRLLTGALKVPKLILTSSFLAFVLSILLAMQLGQNFLPPFNEGSLVINVTSIPGISLDESNTIGTQVERLLAGIPEVNSVARRTGRAELDEHAQGVNASEFDVPFTRKHRSQEAFLSDVRDKLSTLGGVSVSIGQPIGHRIDHMLSGTRSNIAIKLFGSNLNGLFQLGKQIESTITDIPGVVDVNVEQQIEIPQIHIKPKHALLAKYGIRLTDFLTFIDVAFAGETVGQFIDGNMRNDIVLKLQPNARNKIDAIKRTRYLTPQGESIPLYYVADIKSSSGPHTINRENGQRKVVVAANVSGRDLVHTVNDIRAAIQGSITLPKDVYIEYAGQFENQRSASQLIFFASIIAIMIIFFLLVQEFGSVPLALIILVNLPLALMGGIVSVKLTTGIISIASLIGFITLFGIAVRNGMLLISRYKAESDSQESEDEAIITGSLDRLAPILMTALTTGLALAPLAIRSDVAGNEIQSPMAVVILGGLLSSTFLNLFVIPIVYKLYRGNVFSMRIPAVFKVFVVTLLLVSVSSPAMASQFDDMAGTITDHHPRFVLLKEQVVANKAQSRVGLSLKNPELSGSVLDGPFQETELEISQEFNFPTAYYYRAKLRRLTDKEQDDYLAFQRFELNKAVRLSLIELAFLNKKLSYLEKRVALAKKVVQSRERSYQQGQLSIVALSKVKTDLMRKKAQLELLRQPRERLIQTLKLWGQYDDDTNLRRLRYPRVRDHYPIKYADWQVNKHPKLRYLNAVSKKSDAAISLQKAENWPDFAIGYRQAYEDEERFDGYRAAISIPFRENAYKVDAKEKQARVIAAQVTLEPLLLESDISLLVSQFNRLYNTMREFERTINTLNDARSLNNAYEIGQLSATDYFYELNFYYDAIDDFLEMEKHVQLTFQEVAVLTL